MILDDVDVFEFTNSAAGPFCGYILSAWGANVVKVEPPTGAFERQAGRHHYYVCNRGTHSISVDLKSERGRDLIHQIIDESGVDIVLENHSPGVMEALEMDYDTLNGLDEGLIYCSVSGFGHGGPYSDRPGLDPIAQAMSGVMHMTGHPEKNRPESVHPWSTTERGRMRASRSYWR